MKKRILLDSCVVIQCINGYDSPAKWLTRAETVYFSPVVLAECLSGLRDTKTDKERRQALEKMLGLSMAARPPITEETAKCYVRIWRQLSAAGNRIPTNDIWIAAHALDLGATLVTTDPHFRAIPLLDVLYAD